MEAQHSDYCGISTVSLKETPPICRSGSSEIFDPKYLIFSRLVVNKVQCHTLCSNTAGCSFYSWDRKFGSSKCSLFNTAVKDLPFESNETPVFTDIACTVPPPGPFNPICGFPASNNDYSGYSTIQAQYAHECKELCATASASNPKSPCLSYTWAPDRPQPRCILHTQDVASYSPIADESGQLWYDASCNPPSFPDGPICSYSADPTLFLGSESWTLADLGLPEASEIRFWQSACFLYPSGSTVPIFKAYSWDSVTITCTCYRDTVAMLDPPFVVDSQLLFSNTTCDVASSRLCGYIGSLNSYAAPHIVSKGIQEASPYCNDLPRNSCLFKLHVE